MRERETMRGGERDNERRREKERERERSRENFLLDKVRLRG